MWSLTRATLSLSFALGAARAAVCSIPFGGPGVDDTPAVISTLQACGNDSTIVFTANTTYNISTPLNFGRLENVVISVLGNLDLPQSIPYVQSIVNASNGSLTWITMTGENITLSGGTQPGSSIINAYGLPWWQLAPVTLPLGGLANRPHLLSIKANNTEMCNLTLKPIAWGTSMSGNNLYIHDNYVDAKYDLDVPSVFPFNTDGWDISGSNIVMENNHVWNGDDCVAVNSNSENVSISNFECWGGHGMSVSGTNHIKNISFSNITMTNELYAARFKSSLNSVGNISDITWRNIYVQNCTFGVFATGIYYDQNTNRGLTPNNLPTNSTASKVSNFRWENISGSINDQYPGDGSCTTDPCWYAVANSTNVAAVTLQLLNQTATNITLENINLNSIDGKGFPGMFCNPASFVDGVAGLGYQCVDGPLVAT